MNERPTKTMLYSIINKDIARDPKKEHYINEMAFEFTDVGNRDNIRSEVLGKYDPKYEYLAISPGLNLKGQCSNPKCPANKDNETWIRKGYDTFDIGKACCHNKCSQCQTPIKPNSIKTLGYTRAILYIKGVKIENDDYIPVERTLVEDKGELAYFTDFDENIVKWQYIEIKVEPA